MSTAILGHPPKRGRCANSTWLATATREPAATITMVSQSEGGRGRGERSRGHIEIHTAGVSLTLTIGGLLQAAKKKRR